MTIRRDLSVSLLVLLMTASVGWAQTAPARSQEPTRLNLLIESQLVRFTTSGEVLDWRLEVVDAQGQPVFDSGFVSGSALDWPLVNAQGQSIESGLYTYTLTMRGGNVQATRTHRGQLNIERARTIYRVSPAGDETSGDTALTVVGNAEPEPVTGDQRQAPAAEAPAYDRSFRQPLAGPTFVPQPYINGSGTTNLMTKWIDGPAGAVGDTHVAESNGFVVVGDGAARGNLQIFGYSNEDVFAGMGPDLNAGPAFNYGYAGSSFGRSAGFFNVRPDASAVAPNPSLRFMTANVQRMIITNTGNVGIGTASPSAKLEITATGSTIGVSATSVGIGVYGASATFYGVSGWSSSSVGVRGTSDSGLGVHGSSTTSAGVYGESTTSYGVSGASTSGYGVYGTSGSNYAGYFAGNVYVTGTLTQNSDIRLKRDVATLGYGLRDVLRLRPVTWNWKDGPERGRQLGLIAQDLEPVIPELVARGNDNVQTLGVNYIGLVPVVIKAIQEQESKIQDQQITSQDQQAAINRLTDENAALKARLAAIEQILASMNKTRKE